MAGSDPTNEADEQSDRTSRRRYLALAGLAAATGSAGCSALLGGGGADGGDGNGGGGGESNGGTPTPQLTTVAGPATFDRVRVEGPGETRVDQEVTFTVSVANVGGESGDFAGTLTTAEGAQSLEREVSVAAIEPGEHASTDVTATFELADDYVLRVSDGDAAATHEIAATARTAEVGGTLDLGNGLSVTLTDVVYEVGVFYTAREMGSSPPAYYAPGGDQVLGVLRFAVENTATEGRRFGANVAPSGGSVLPEYPRNSLGATETLDGSSLLNAQERGARIQAGQRVEGWLLTQLPRSAADEGIAVDWQRDAPDTAPERRWTVERAALPSFALDEWTLPAESAPGEITYSVTVRNEGDADGVFRGVVDRGGSDASNWRVSHQLSQPIPAGGSHTFELADDWRFVDDHAFRVRPLGETRTVDFFAPTLAVGESLATPFGSITVTTAATGDQLVSSPGRGNNETTKTPEAGQFVFIEVEYDRQREVAIPNLGRLARYSNGFLLNDGETTYEGGGAPEGDHDFHRPISGTTLNSHRGEQIPVGEARRGWLVFDVPAGVSLGDATLSWRNSRDDRTSRATWELG
ncbi:MAG: hypothetical protein V5A28_03415 [Haloarculaceae archaeon]